MKQREKEQRKEVKTQNPTSVSDFQNKEQCTQSKMQMYTESRKYDDNICRFGYQIINSSELPLSD